MGYSQVVFSSIGMSDITPPGAPQLALARTGTLEVEARVTLPSADEGGTALSGMTELVLALMQEQVAGQNPFEGVAAASLASHAEGAGGKSAVIFLTDADAGKLKTQRFGSLTLNKVYWVAAVVKDESVAAYRILELIL